MNPSVPNQSEEMLSKRVNTSTDAEEIQQEPEKKIKFADEIIIDGKKVLTISSDKLFYTEPIYEREKTTRWSDPHQRKSRFASLS